MLRRLSALLLLLALTGGVRAADSASPTPPADLDAQRHQAQQAADAALQRGPADIPLGQVAVLHLPSGTGYVPAKEAGALAKLYGNAPDDSFLGWVVAVNAQGVQWGDWLAYLSYNPSGHIAEDDASDWKADELLKTMREATEAGNAERTRLGVPAIVVTRWIETPQYDRSAHRLVWSAEVVAKERKPNDAALANYNTYVLGRTGFVALDFVTDEESVEGQKPIARDLLGRIEFRDGQRYGQFNASTDKVAEFGLAALVAGVAAKKLGLLAVITAFLLKFAKIAVVAVLAFWKRIAGFFSRLFGRAPKPETPTTIGTPSSRPMPPPDKAPGDGDGSP